MNEQPNASSLCRLGVKSQTVVPKEVRAALGSGPGDQIGYSIQNGRVLRLTTFKDRRGRAPRFRVTGHYS
jgi:bifunctional DNA-binding transcriptional regulator/antitoxin component of YhaV-PrlF toxin-antitoxin module